MTANPKTPAVEKLMKLVQKDMFEQFIFISQKNETYKSLEAAITELIADRDKLRAENERLLNKIETWRDDLEAIDDSPIHGDPHATVRLIVKYMTATLQTRGESL